MPGKKPLEAKGTSPADSVSGAASLWLRQFLTVFEDTFLNLCRELDSGASRPEYCEATLRAVFETLRDSSSNVDDDSIAAIIGKVLLERRQGSVTWNSSLNQRRFELIDKEIQGSLTPVEQIELAGLTRMLRERVETEETLPVEGARDLHRKLLALKSPRAKATDKPR